MMGKSGSLPGWQLCRGISGSFRVEWVAGFVWNQWQPWSGIRNDLWLLVHPDLRGVVRIHALMDFVTEAIRENGHRLAGTALTRSAIPPKNYGDQK
ncbi:hypothetical protein Maqu_3186 [Marinobacter nauticus VT8]|uniref:Uncharacterized protein n=1 Tax=Marinobacter nauticus (strain ATCC 700491 / DSM 11845 / VT8) TaxID=351348 RepID=A1U5J1_MARN8|nr:hypothetical protein Maqu_3186 [Marinobacter nauticus VT8]